MTTSEAKPVHKADFTLECPIVKADEELRLVTGIVLEPDEVDSQGDTIDVSEVRKAAHLFLRRYNEGTTLGLMHKEFEDIGIRVVESYIAPIDFELGGQSVKKGSWIMTIHVISDDVWIRIKDGELTGFSIGGVAVIEDLTN